MIARRHNRSIGNIPRRKHRWWLLAAGTGVLIVGYLWLASWTIEAELLIAAVSGLFASAFFYHRSHAEDARFFRELFTSFNARYDDLNDELWDILESKDELNADQEKTLIDYFNLCAEEWLFHELEYIYEPVWEAWHNGMRQYGKDARIAAFWREQQATDSYYGFEFPVQIGGQ